MCCKLASNNNEVPKHLDKKTSKNDTEHPPVEDTTSFQRDKPQPKKFKYGTRLIKNTNPLTYLLILQIEFFVFTIGNYIHHNIRSVITDKKGNMVWFWYHSDGLCNEECPFKKTFTPLAEPVLIKEIKYMKSELDNPIKG